MGSKRNDRHLQAVPAAAETAESVVRQALQSDHPFELLDFVGGTLEVLLRGVPPEGVFDEDDAITVESVVSGLLLMDSREITAVLYVYAALLEGTPLATEISEELGRRNWELPEWVRDIGDITIEETMCAPEPPEDGETVLVSFRWPSGLPLTVVVATDFNIANAAIDGFFSPEDMAAITGPLMEGTDVAPAPQPLAPEEARARIAEALAKADEIQYPFETATWPTARPVIEWVIRRLPPGGKGYGPTDWTVDDELALIDAFLATKWGRPVTNDPNTESALIAIIGYAVESGVGDPLRWSPDSVVIALSEWIPHMLADYPETRATVPEVMRQFIRYSHAQKGLSADFTEETLTALDDWVRDSGAEESQQSFDVREGTAQPSSASQGGGWAFAWFPEDQWAEARARFRLTTMPAGHVEYCGVIEGHIRETSKSSATPLSVAPLQVEEILEYARSHDMEPDSDEIRPALAAEKARTGRAIAWPPGRNEPCWCSSGRKYKQCCLGNG